LRQNYREYQNPRFLFSNFIFFENCAVYEIMWKRKKVKGKATPLQALRVPESLRLPDFKTFGT